MSPDPPARPDDHFRTLHARAAAGDPSAFAQLWTDTHPILLRYLRVLAGAAAEDVASQTWLKVIGRLDTFSGDEPAFRRWLITIARHTHVDALRRANRRPEWGVEDLDALPVGPQAWGPDPADLVAEQLGTDAAIRLIATLPPDQAELVMLRVVVGLDVAEVAQLVGRSPGAVRVAVHRALRRLERALTEVAAVSVGGRCNAGPQGGVLGPR